MIGIIPAGRILEIGAGDYSFDYLRKPEQTWMKVDIESPCDFICDLNNYDLNIPLSANSMDLIICTEIMEHLLWPHILLKEICRILVLDGGAILSVPNIASLSYRAAWIMGRLPSCAASGNLPRKLRSTAYEIESGKTVGGHVIDFNLKRLVSLLMSGGFKLVKLKGSGIIWHRQILPYWLVPPSLASNIICLAKKVEA